MKLSKDEEELVQMHQCLNSETMERLTTNAEDFVIWVKVIQIERKKRMSSDETSIPYSPREVIIALRTAYLKMERFS